MVSSDRPKHLLHVFPGFDIGGVQLRMSSIIAHFGGRYRHTIAAMNDNRAAADRLPADLDIRFADLNLKGASPLATHGALKRLIAEAAPDLLLTYNWGAVEAALAGRRFRNLRQIHLESGFGPEEADRQIPRRVMFRRLALGGVWRLVVPSLTLVDIVQDVWKQPASRVLHIPNGVDCDLYASAPDPALVPGFDPPAGDIVIGTVAPLRAEKNIERLIRAFASLDGLPVRLLVVGDGPERAALEALAADLGVNARVYFAGYVDAPHKVLGLMDVYAISSDTEQMPNTVNQAMAAGLPVAGLAVGDVAHIVSDENRPLIAPKGDDAAFAAALRTLSTDPERRAAVASANARHVRETYDQSIMFEAYRKLFDGEPT